MPTKFNYPVKLFPLKIPNAPKEIIGNELNDIPYLLYEVENLKDGSKIVINKPGGKRSFGRLSKNDFMVFVYHPDNNELWLISHDEIYEDIQIKLTSNLGFGVKVIDALKQVCNGEEPDDVLKDYNFEDVSDTDDLSVELLLKVYKWIWGQEDVNYPNGEGRWLSMNALIELKEKILNKKVDDSSKQMGLNENPLSQIEGFVEIDEINSDEINKVEI